MNLPSCFLLMPLARNKTKVENMKISPKWSATISWFSKSRLHWLSHVVRLVEGKMTGVLECFEMLYTSQHMDMR